MRILIALFILTLFSFGCSKKSRLVPNTNLLPPPFDFVVVDSSGNPIIASQSQNIELWYEASGQRNDITDLIINPIISSSRFSYYSTSVFCPLRSADNISKYFYMRIDNKAIDTIYLDVQKLSQLTGGEYYTFSDVKFNRITVTLDKSHQPALFILKQN